MLILRVIAIRFLRILTHLLHNMISSFAVQDEIASDIISMGIQVVVIYTYVIKIPYVVIIKTILHYQHI